MIVVALLILGVMCAGILWGMWRMHGNQEAIRAQNATLLAELDTLKRRQEAAEDNLKNTATLAVKHEEWKQKVERVAAEIDKASKERVRSLTHRSPRGV